MSTGVEFARALMRQARETFEANVRDLTIEDALFAAGGYRSALGVLKHLGGWHWVYWSYAFEAEPRHYPRVDWPRGLIGTIDPSQPYLEELIAWAGAAMRAWDGSLMALPEAELAAPHRLHWGATAPLADIAVLIANHATYHTGEMNMLLSIKRGEAWEYSEEVEENHIDTFGHALRPEWMTPAQAVAYEARWRAGRATGP